MELIWSNVKGKKRTQQLCAGERVLATIEFPSVWKSDALVTYGEDRYTIKVEGFWQSRIVVRDAVTNQEIATLKRGMSTSTITFAHGRTFTLRSRGVWKPVWEIFAPDNALVVSAAQGKGFIRQTTVITVPDSASAYPEVRVLLPLLFFARLIAQRQAAAAGGGG